MDSIHLTPRARATILWVVAGIALLLLWQLRGLVVPLIWAGLTAYLLNPVVVWLARRTGLARRVWAVGVFLGLLGLIALGAWLIIPEMSAQVEGFSRELPSHAREAGRLLGQDSLQLLGVTVDLAASDEAIRQRLAELGVELGRVAVPVALPYVLDGLFKLLLYLVSTFFLMFDAHRIGATVSHFTPPGARTELGPWLQRVDRLLGAYIRGQAVLFALMTLACYVVLTALDVRFAPLLAVFSGFVLLIPYIGPYIAGGAATLVALTQGYAPYGWSPVVLAMVVALAYTVLRQLEANFVMPFLIGKLVDLHPLTVMFVVLAGAALGGVLGLLIAVPVATTIKIGLEYLYGKLRETPPRTLVPIEAHDGWADIARAMREGVETARRNSSGQPRLLLSVPAPPAALLDPATFHRLSALIQETESDTILFTSDPALRDMAEAEGISVVDTPSGGPQVTKDLRHVSREEREALELDQRLHTNSRAKMEGKAGRSDRRAEVAGETEG
jgi:predicted PurR-regulated permease PerM